MIEARGSAPLPAARAALRAARERLADFPALHRRAGQALLEWAQRNFAAQGALLEEFPSGWPALSPATLASRLRRGRGTRVLYDSGQLARGFTVLPGERQAVVDNPVPHAAFHQEGRRVPRRPVFPGPRQAQALAAQAAREHVTEALR
jgi:phage gpG-like protein